MNDLLLVLWAPEDTRVSHWSVVPPHSIWLAGRRSVAVQRGLSRRRRRVSGPKEECRGKAAGTVKRQQLVGRHGTLWGQGEDNGGMVQHQVKEDKTSQLRSVGGSRWGDIKAWMDAMIMTELQNILLPAYVRALASVCVCWRERERLFQTVPNGHMMVDEKHKSSHVSLPMIQSFSHFTPIHLCFNGSGMYHRKGQNLLECLRNHVIEFCFGSWQTQKHILVFLCLWGLS